MAEREAWETVAERYGLYRKMLGKDGYDLAGDLSLIVFKGLNETQLRAVLSGHQLNADKFFGNEEFWEKIKERLKPNE